MTKRILLLLLALVLSGSSPAKTDNCTGEQTKVIVVMSNNAYAYHKSRNSSVVKRATHEVKEVTLEKAKEMGRKPCGICFK